MEQENVNKKRLVYSILKFLDREIQEESENVERREGIEIAAQCLEASFNVSPNNPQSEAAHGSNVDLLQSISSRKFTSKLLTDDMRQQADKFKSQGNEFVKQEKYKEAVEAYNAAIQIDNNNAIYFCNRAAAHSQLGNNDQALSDCFRSIEIDPKYCKAYGRLGAVHLSMNKVHEALDAYKTAHTLDPNNENYKQSIRLCEERLNSTRTNASTTTTPNLSSMFGNLLGGANGPPNMMSFLNNPALMNMASQFIQNPQVQDLMSNLVTNLDRPEGGPVNMENLLQTGQRMASQLSTSNPDLIESLRRQMTNPSNSNPSNNSPPDSNNPSDQS